MHSGRENLLVEADGYSIAALCDNKTRAQSCFYRCRRPLPDEATDAADEAPVTDFPPALEEALLLPRMGLG